MKSFHYLPALAFIVGMGSAHGITLLSESFDGAGVPPSVSGINATDLTVSNGVLSATNLNEVGSGHVRARFEFPTVTLDIGETLSAVFTVRLDSSKWGDNAFRNLETAFWNSADGDGFGGWLDTSPNNRTRINYYTDAGGGSTDLEGRIFVGGGQPNIGSDQTIFRNIELKIERTSATEAAVDYFGENDSGDLIGLTQTSDQGFVTFDRFEINGAGGSALNWSMESMEITVIPEPSSMLLGLLGGMFLLRRRR